MDAGTIITALLVVLARITDVTLGTLRTVAIVNGRRSVAWCLGFFEVLIWIYAVSAVIGNLKQPIMAVAYALGFATGNYIGITIERLIAQGEQVVRVFTKKGSQIAIALRRMEFRVTQLEGMGRDGRVDVLFVQTRRRETPRVTTVAREVDADCFFTVDNIRYTSRDLPVGMQPSGWRAVLKKK